MPLNPINPNQFDRNNNENTMGQGVMNSSLLSLMRLKRRYANIDFEHCITELCNYLRHRGVQNDIFDKFRVAERALYPDFGSVGRNTSGLLANILYYWMAANDESPSIESSTDDRRACFVRALYECQRGNNAVDGGASRANSAVINFQDNRSPTDQTICHYGCNNKFAEVFVGMHPDVTLIVELGNRITQLLQGFVAEYAFSQAISYQDFIAGNYDFDTVFTPYVKSQIRMKIVNTLGFIDGNSDGLMSNNDVRFLDDSLLALEYLSYKVTIAGVAQNEDLSEVQVQNLIADANNQMQYEMRSRNERAVMARVVAQEPVVQFDYNRIATIIRNILPVPNNQARVYGAANFEDIRFRPGQNIFTRTSQNELPFWMRTNYSYSFYTGPTQEQLNAAMQPQPANIDSSQATNVRRLRLIKMGLMTQQYFIQI